MRDLPSEVRSQLFYYPVMVGPWEIFYGGEDGMLRNDFHETLELREDGTFRWEPLPIWAKPNGRWGLVKDALGTDEWRERARQYRRRGSVLREVRWLVPLQLSGAGRLQQGRPLASELDPHAG